MAFFRWIMYVLRMIGSLFMPFVGGLRSPAFGKGLLWTLHVLVVIGTLVGLHFLNQYFGFNRLLPGKSEMVRKNWLPIIFILIYILGWLGWWLWKLLVVETESIEFPDITYAWNEAMAALQRANIDIKQLPVFIILGRPDSSMDALFQGSRQKYIVRQVPHADAPLTLYATQEGIYITCVGCSLSGEYSSQLAGVTSVSGNEQGNEADIEQHSLGAMTAQPGMVAGTDEIQQIVQRAGREGRNVTREERRRIRFLTRQDRSYRSCVRDADEAARLAARFEAFCRLVIRDRWPYCPINGVLVLLPFSATDSDQDALDCGTAIGQDLAIARRVLQVNSSIITLLCDLESATGFSDFLEKFPEKQRQQRIGQRCPKVPHLESQPGRSGPNSQAYSKMVKSLASWVGRSVTAGWVYKHFQLDRPGYGDEYTAVVRSNARLFLFMNDMKEREDRIGQILDRAVASEDHDLPFLGGCYIAGTGPDAEREQGFVAGVFRRLSDEENFVTWTDQALAEEAGYVRAVGAAQIVFGVLLIGLLGLWGYMFLK